MTGLDYETRVGGPWVVSTGPEHHSSNSTWHSQPPSGPVCPPKSRKTRFEAQNGHFRAHLVPAAWGPVGPWGGCLGREPASGGPNTHLRPISGVLSDPGPLTSRLEKIENFDFFGPRPYFWAKIPCLAKCQQILKIAPRAKSKFESGF